MKKVLGLGNALVDILNKIPNEAILQQFNLAKGSMQLVDKAFTDMVLQNTKNYEQQQTAGGSAANTIHGLAHLGIFTGFIGKVGRDEFGDFFIADLSKSGINAQLLTGNAETGRAIALITPDSERTFATYLGSSIELSASDLKLEIIKGYDILHIEGYLVQNHDLIQTAVKMAKENGLKVSLDLASYNIVLDNIAFLRDIVSKYVDIVFANEEEAKAFTGKNPELALGEIAQMCEIAVVKLGKKGSSVQCKEKKDFIDIFEAKCLDTTGAGDLFAAGFLYGYIKGFDLKVCGTIASLLSSKVIEVLGAKIVEKDWKAIEGYLQDKGWK